MVKDNYINYKINGESFQNCFLEVINNYEYDNWHDDICSMWFKEKHDAMWQYERI